MQLKPRHLSAMTVSSASTSSGGRTTTGSLSTKSTDYTLKTTEKAGSAEEMTSLRPLLPSKAKGAYLLGQSDIPISLSLSGPVPHPPDPSQWTEY